MNRGRRRFCLGSRSAAAAAMRCDAIRYGPKKLAPYLQYSTVQYSSNDPIRFDSIGVVKLS